MKKVNIEITLLDALKENKLPVLILDPRWHAMFPPDQKPPKVRQLEEKVGDLMKEQGKLVNEIKDLRRAKKKIMDTIVANMNHPSEKKSMSSQKLILEMNERIEKNSNRVMELPYQIKSANEELLITGVKICYEKFGESENILSELRVEINNLRETLDEKIKTKIQLEQTNDTIYSFMHALLGPSAIELFDKTH